MSAYGDGAWGLLGDPTRRAIFELLARAPRSVQELADAAADQPARRCRSTCGCCATAAWSSATAEGTRRIYRFNPEGVTALRAWLDGVWDDALAGFHKAAEDGRSDRQEEPP